MAATIVVEEDLSSLLSSFASHRHRALVRSRLSLSLTDPEHTFFMATLSKSLKKIKIVGR
jgi:hypothetical protein